MLEQSCWIGLDRFPELTSDVSAQHFDVGIIGGGYTGLNAAMTLARAGLQVAVFEAGPIGCGASSKNAGMLLPGVKAPLEVLIHRYGLEFARDVYRWSVAAIHYVGELVATENIPCDWQNSGSLELAVGDKCFDSFKMRLDLLATEFDERAPTLLGRDNLGQEIGTESYRGGILDPTSCSLNPVKYLSGLARAAHGAGAAIFQNCRVNAIAQGTGGVQLKTSQATLRCDRVVIATNGYTPWRFWRVRRNLLPIGSYVIATEPLPIEVQRAISPAGRMFYDSNKLLNYFRLTPDGRMLFGGRKSLVPDADLGKVADTLRSTMAGIFPQLAHTPVTNVWSGRLGVTVDMLPHLVCDGRVYAGYGYCGHGVSLASYTGYELARGLLGEKTAAFHRKRRWALPFPPESERVILPVLTRYYRYVDSRRGLDG